MKKTHLKTCCYSCRVFVYGLTEGSRAPAWARATPLRCEGWLFCASLRWSVHSAGPACPHPCPSTKWDPWPVSILLHIGIPPLDFSCLLKLHKWKCFGGRKDKQIKRCRTQDLEPWHEESFRGTWGLWALSKRPKETGKEESTRVCIWLQHPDWCAPGRHSRAPLITHGVSQGGLRL